MGIIRFGNESKRILIEGWTGLAHGEEETAVELIGFSQTDSKANHTAKMVDKNLLSITMESGQELRFSRSLRGSVTDQDQNLKMENSVPPPILNNHDSQVEVLENFGNGNLVMLEDEEMVAPKMTVANNQKPPNMHNSKFGNSKRMSEY